MISKAREATPFILSALAALTAGVFVALQARVNGALGVELEDGISAALFSFSSGWVLVAIAIFASAAGRRGLKRIIRKISARELPGWLLLGGAFGGFLVMSQGVAAGLLGVSLFTVAVVLGQSVSGLVIDSKGLFALQKRPLSKSRILGAFLVVLGLVLILEQPDTSVLGYVVLPLISGFGLGFQQAINGKVRIETESAIAATFINFGTGTIFLLALRIFTLPASNSAPTWPTEWWLYTGGLVGVTFIAVQVIVVSKLGVLGLGVLLGTGQLLGSVALDVLFPLSGELVSLPHLIGVIVALVGAVLVQIKRTASHGSTESSSSR